MQSSAMLGYRRLVLGGLVSFAGLRSCSVMAEGKGNADWKSATSIYDFSAIDIDGNEVSLEKYRGNVCIIVNVASK